MDIRNYNIDSRDSKICGFHCLSFACWKMLYLDVVSCWDGFNWVKWWSFSWVKKQNWFQICMAKDSSPFGYRAAIASLLSKRCKHQEAQCTCLALAPGGFWRLPCLYSRFGEWGVSAWDCPLFSYINRGPIWCKWFCCENYNIFCSDSFFYPTKWSL